MDKFDPKEVMLAGEIMHARPIEWDGDVLLDETKPIRFESVCGGCGELVQFSNNEIYVIDGIPYAQCPRCDGPAPNVVPPSDNVASRSINVDQDSGKKTVSTPRMDDLCPFQDPVEAGELKVQS